MGGNKALSPLEIQQSLSIFTNIDQLIYVSDPHTHEVLYANAAIKKLFGEIVGHPCYKVLQNSDEPCSFCTNEHIFGRNEGKSYIWEFRNRVNKRWYRCIDKAIPWTDGRRVRCEMAFDITDNKKVSDNFDRLFDLSADLQFILDFRGIIKRVNPSVENTFGYPPEKIIGRPFRDFVHPDDLDKSVAAFMKVIRGKQIKHLEQRVRSRDGSYRYVIWVGTPVCEERLMHAVARDITERKRMEEELRISEERYKVIMDNAGSAIMVNDEEKTLLFVNNEFAKLTGYTREELMGKKKWTEFIRGDDLAKMNKYHMIRRLDPTAPPRNYTVTFFNKSGKGKAVAITVSLVPGTERSIVSLQDISELKEAEQALKTAKEHLQRQNEELRKLDNIKDGIIRDVSHELKTPVAKFSMQMEIMRAALEKRGLLPEFSKPLKIIEKGIRRQERVIQNIMDLSRLESGGRKYAKDRVRLDQVLANVVDDYRSAFEAVDMQMITSLEQVTITSDPAMLWHVFSNLLNNALKYRKKTGENSVAISLANTGRNATAVIYDNGIGMTWDEAGKAFERFYQASSSIEGCGVGLPICKMIVEELGGRISIESEGIGLGTKVTVELPGKDLTEAAGMGKNK